MQKAEYKLKGQIKCTINLNTGQSFPTLEYPNWWTI